MLLVQWLVMHSLLPHATADDLQRAADSRSSAAAAVPIMPSLVERRSGSDGPEITLALPGDEAHTEYPGVGELRRCDSFNGRRVILRVMQLRMVLVLVQ
jgi:hypothetical protein